MKPPRALFIDRDGVVNVDAGYVYRIEDVRFIDGIFDLCRVAVNHGYLVIVITNQAGIGRGRYSEDDFSRLTDWMLKQFEKASAPISAVYHCPYHPEHCIGQYRVESPDRKPNPGMILRAAEQHGLDLLASFMVGDKECDMEAALRAGVGTRCLFSSKQYAVSSAATHQVKSLTDAATLLHTVAETSVVFRNE